MRRPHKFAVAFATSAMSSLWQRPQCKGTLLLVHCPWTMRNPYQETYDYIPTTAAIPHKTQTEASSSTLMTSLLQASLRSPCLSPKPEVPAPCGLAPPVLVRAKGARVHGKSRPGATRVARDIVVYSARRKWNFERFKGHAPREDVPVQLASRSRAKPCSWLQNHARGCPKFTKNESARGFPTARVKIKTGRSC